ncbi:uncharacterized protein LOC127247310 [Andrographis paniculata]|uniref:uncharacterized protein LOC127247310 n=1 Tax=Andrographis paniculata TaxID=175694 RepID=UPI0021E723DB|nr:uncharacterized protein LOC127247310 [Andrographis paniculata]
MAEKIEACVVEIDVDRRRKLIAGGGAVTAAAAAAAIQHHPLAEIAQSSGHFLLLKLWQREEELYSRGLSRKELRKSTIGGEIFQLCCFFFVFHGLFFAILLASSSEDRQCNKWWIPSAVSACTSLAIAFLVQLKLRWFWKVDRQVQKDRAEGRALARCVQELRMKGRSFDLRKEPQNGKKLKSSSVEIKWRPLALCSRVLT